MTAAASPFRTTPLRLAAGFVVGAASGWGVSALGRALGLDRAHRGWPEHLGLILAVVLVALGAMMAVMTADRRRLARVLEAGVDEPASGEETAQVRLQAAVMIVAGLLVMGVALMSGSLLAGASDGVRTAAFGVFALLMAAQTWMNWRVWATADEFQRRVFLQAATLAFCLGQGGLFVWAAASKLFGAAEPGAFGSALLLTAIYLGASIIAAIWSRR